MGNMVKKKGRRIFSSYNPEIYNEAVKSFGDKDVQVVNFEVTRVIAKVIKSMYGPKGLSKMIIDVSNETEITQKGHKVVKTFKSRLPISLMLINLVKTQEKRCGDGTKTALLFIAFLLEKTREMLSIGISPQVINKGFFIAMNKALEILEENIIPFDIQDEKFLKNIISSVMNHKLSHNYEEKHDNLILKTLECNKNLFFESDDFDFTDILFRKVQGKGINDSEVINGMIIYKDKPNLSLNNEITNARILLIRKSLDFFIPGNRETLEKEIQINTIDKYQEFSQFRESYYKGLADLLKTKNVNVILCQKKINPYFVDYCSSIGIVALELVGEEVLKKLSKLLAAPVISSIRNFSDADLGLADKVEFKKIAGDEMFFIFVKIPKILTFLLRGGISNVTDELEEIFNSSLRVAIQSIKDKKLLPGGGALECEISHKLKNYATTFPDKHQIVIREYAKAIENLPAHLILNSAVDPLELIPQLRMEHSNGKRFTGFDCDSNKLVDVVNKGILDGYTTKKHAIKIASEMARQIIRIDGLVMVFDPKLYEKIEQEAKEEKSQKHQERVRKYINKHDDNLFSDLYQKS